MSHSIYYVLLLMFLSSGDVLLVKASGNTISCAYDKCCQAMSKLIKAFDELATEMQEIHGKQAKDLEELKENLNKLATDVNENQGKQAKELEELTGNLNNKLEKLATSVNENHDSQAKDLKELTGNLKNELDKLATNLNENQGRQAKELKENLNNNLEKLEKLATNVNENQEKQAKNLEELKANVDLTHASTVAISTQLEKHSKDLLSHDDRLKAHNASHFDQCKPSENPPDDQSGAKDCSDIRSRVSGVYRLSHVSGDKRIEMDVYCDFQITGQSWLVFQRRKSGRIDFNRNWNDYANGFGDLADEFWIGNEKISLLTMNKKYKLRIETEDVNGVKKWAEYSTFSVKPSTDKYRLTVAGYSGNAGDSLAYHNNMLFSTKDADNDLYKDHCAVMFPGGWWFNACFHSNLNGLHLGGPNKSPVGIRWYTQSNSLKASEMKIAAL